MTDEDEIFSILSSTRALAGKRNSRMRFRCHRKRIDRSRLHYRLDAFLTVHTKPFEIIELHVVTHVVCHGHATNTRACDIVGHRFHFDAFSTVH